MTYEEFRDIMCHWVCGNCKHCNVRADLDGVESTCKRLDHKHFSFAKPIFHSYHCGNDNGHICGDFEPKEWQKWLYENWDSTFLVEYRKRLKETDTVNICIDHDWEVRYEIKAIDFFDNTFIDENGNLKWLRKGYYKQSRKSPIGYTYIWEYPDGEKIEGANNRR